MFALRLVAVEKSSVVLSRNEQSLSPLQPVDSSSRSHNTETDDKVLVALGECEHVSLSCTQPLDVPPITVERYPRLSEFLSSGQIPAPEIVEIEELVS